MPLSTAARRLLADCIDSFERLELVVHLYRLGAEPRTIEELARATALSPGFVAAALHTLAEAGLTLCDENGYWVLDRTGKWRAALDVLVRVYEEDRTVVHDAMTRLALQRIRSHAARAFRDAALRQPTKGEPED